MLTHHRMDPVAPARVVVLGAGGVIGKPLTVALRAAKIPVLGLRSADLDLQADGAAAQLKRILRDDDAVVFLSALTPDKGRDIGTLMANLRMAQAVGAAIAAVGCPHLVYLSSDAVYRSGDVIIDEATPADPLDTYGLMHKAREVMLMSAAPTAALAILRCTMVCSADDTHNSYGPNRFRREAATGAITLHGEGAETRDYVFADDVAELVRLVLMHRSAGLLNLASGRSWSFAEVARLVADSFDPPARIVCAAAGGPVTHRRFDPAALHRAFPGFRFRPLDRIVRDLQRSGRPLAKPAKHRAVDIGQRETP